MPPADPNARTFSLRTPADLFRKMRFEADALRQAPPDDLMERACTVMDAVTSAYATMPEYELFLRHNEFRRL